MMKSTNRIFALCMALILILLLLLPVSSSVKVRSEAASYARILADTISRVIATCPGEVGVAVIINSKDTVSVNNKPVYPMMSVFKVHQAMAVCHDFDSKGISLDSLITVRREELDADTWSPMLKDYEGPVIRLSVRNLLRYTLAQSDNNASNILFDRLVDVENTDRFISKLIPRSSFRIAYAESDIHSDHDKAYSNYTSPVGAAMLFNRLFTDSLMNGNSQCFIREVLRTCVTGKDRIIAPLLEEKGVTVAHKTGSGYTNEKGILAAHNDVAYITLPNGMCYTLAVFIRDFKGDESQASKAMARISSIVYFTLCDFVS